MGYGMKLYFMAAGSNFPLPYREIPPSKRLTKKNVVLYFIFIKDVKNGFSMFRPQVASKEIAMFFIGIHRINGLFDQHRRPLLPPYH